jgi:GntR family transcriptional regulator
MVIRKQERNLSVIPADIQSSFSILGLPRYAEIREVLRQEIAQGHFKPGEKIPPEEELSLQYQASRMTIRRSIADLIAEGSLYRRRGVGTFVAQRQINRDHVRLTSFFEEATALGMEAHAQILSHREIAADVHLADALNIGVGDPVIRVESLRTLDGEPVTIQHDYLPKRLFPDLRGEDLLLQASWKIYERNVRIKQALEKLQARAATTSQARLLKTRKGAPLLYKERVVFAEDGTPVAYVECWNRGDKYTCRVLLTR